MCPNTQLVCFVLRLVGPCCSLTTLTCTTADTCSLALITDELLPARFKKKKTFVSLSKHENKSSAAPLLHITLKPRSHSTRAENCELKMDNVYDSVDADSNVPYYFQALKINHLLLLRWKQICCYLSECEGKQLMYSTRLETTVYILKWDAHGAFDIAIWHFSWINTEKEITQTPHGPIKQ